jgi:hypothetical protein
MKIRYSSIICFLIFAAFAHGCKNSNSTQVWSTKDSWYKTSSASVGLSDEKQFVEVKFHEVTNSMQSKAQNLLKQKSIVPLSLAQAKTFTSGQFKQVKAKRPYLVRAVYLNKGTGAYSVFLRGKKLVVSHGSLGRSDVPMKRQALIVYLSALPTEVFVVCEMAE